MLTEDDTSGDVCWVDDGAISCDEDGPAAFDTDGDADCDTKSDIEVDSDVVTDNEFDGDMEVDSDGDIDCEVDADIDADGDIDVDIDAGGDIEAEVDSDTDADIDCDIDGDIDVKGDSKLDIEGDTAETKKVSDVFTFTQVTVWIATEQTKNCSETYPIFDHPLSRSVRRTGLRRPWRLPSLQNFITTVVPLIITITKFSNLIGYQQPLFQHL